MMTVVVIRGAVGYATFFGTLLGRKGNKLVNRENEHK